MSLSYPLDFDVYDIPNSLCYTPGPSNRLRRLEIGTYSMKRTRRKRLYHRNGIVENLFTRWTLVWSMVDSDRKDENYFTIFNDLSEVCSIIKRGILKSLTEKKRSVDKNPVKPRDKTKLT